MKFKYILILSALIGQILSLSAREVTSFNEGWLFKRGPFSQGEGRCSMECGLGNCKLASYLER